MVQSALRLSRLNDSQILRQMETKNQGVSSFLSCMMGVLREVVYEVNSEKVMVNTLQNLTFKRSGNFVDALIKVPRL